MYGPLARWGAGEYQFSVDLGPCPPVSSGGQDHVLPDHRREGLTRFFQRGNLMARVFAPGDSAGFDGGGIMLCNSSRSHQPWIATLYFAHPVFWAGIGAGSPVTVWFRTSGGRKSWLGLSGKKKRIWPLWMLGT